MDWGNMEFFEYLVYVIPNESHTYDYFLDNFEVLTQPIPRVMWSGKPKGEPFRRIFLFDYGTPFGMTRSIAGEGWYAMGWFGVVIWSSLWGAAMGTIYRRFTNSKQTTMQTACYMIFIPSLIVSYRDGLLSTTLHAAGAYLSPIGLWYMMARGFGVPKAAELREKARKLAEKAGLVGAADPESNLAMAEARRIALLPPAVRRRRAALASLAAPSEEA
jgi:hypothetical protein